MIRYAALAAILTLAACDPSQFPGAEPEPRVLPAAVQAAMLPGVPDSIIIQDPQGCYLVSNELTEPRQGYFLRDNSGEPLCYDREGLRVAYVPPAPAEVEEMPEDEAS